MCTSPRPASLKEDGSISFSQKTASKELLPFNLPCGKCIECRLERAREWSVRCIHEASQYDDNIFITLTYDNEHIPKDGKLNYEHFREFIKKLRKTTNNQIGFFMCGEYGEKTQRPHYHACIFNYDFKDKKHLRTSNLGDHIFTSETLEKLWPHGISEIGNVTKESAGYVARYVLKKQKDSPLQPFQKMSRQNAIGKKWIEKYYKDVFINAQGSIVLEDGSKTKCPRYYEKWLKENQPELWITYITETKPENTKRLQEKAEKENATYYKEATARGTKAYQYKKPLSRKNEILKQKAKKA